MNPQPQEGQGAAPGPPRPQGPAGEPRAETPPPPVDRAPSGFADFKSRLFVPAPEAAGGAAPTAAPGRTPGEHEPGGSALASPAFVEGYELQRVIGRGGMGTVYQVRNLHLGRLEALKVISAGGFATPESRQRFSTEMKAMATLAKGCDGIVEVYHAGEIHREPFFTMSLEPSDLAKLVKPKQPMDPRKAADLVRQVATAVAYAHRQGVIHRDLKPSNILLSAQGKPKIADFGLAQLWSEQRAAREARPPEGTPSYMPPEQAGAPDEPVGPRADIYSLGAILYELLTGTPPFEGDSVDEVLRQVREEPPTEPRLYNPRVPRKLQRICLKCLAKSPAQRYASAEELAQALQRYLHPRWRRWHTWAAGLGVIALAGVLATAYGVTRAQVLREQSAVQQHTQDAAAAERQGKLHTALDHYRDALAGVSGLINRASMHLDLRRLRLHRAALNTQRGILFERLRALAAAEEALENARTELEESSVKQPDDPAWLLPFAEVHHNLGIVCGDQPQKQRAAVEHFQEATRLREHLCQLEKNRQYCRDLARSYGYQGDAQLALDLPSEAMESYRKAAEIREALVQEEPSDVDARCQRARDFLNLGYYYEWQGDRQRALVQYEDRRAYYQTAGFPRVLPGEFRTDRADCLLAIAELKLDEPGSPPAAVLDLLNEAEAEYLDLVQRGSKAEGKEQPELKAGQARILVARGKYYCRQGEAVRAREALQAALPLLTQLEDDAAAAPSDLYRIALAHALLGQLATDDQNRGQHAGLSMEYLRRAVRVGFNHLERLRGDIGFQELTEWDAFQGIVQRIKQLRPTLQP